jgi:hypothetical protein
LRRLALIGALGSALVATPASSAAAKVVPLPWPPTVLPTEPPLAPPTEGVLPLEFRLKGRLQNREHVVIGLEENGLPRSIRVLQTIEVNRLGDYVFSIPAPVQEVVPGPGTAAPPGQRVNQILWEGFSPGHRVLAAWADLRLAESASSLPVRVDLLTTVDGRPLEPGERRSGDLRVMLTISNRTAATARSFTAEPEPVSLAQVLSRIRSAIRHGVFAEGLNVGLRGAETPETQQVAAPLAVEGALRFGPGAEIDGAPSGVMPLAAQLDGLKRRRLRLTIRGRAVNMSTPKLELRVRTTAVKDGVSAARNARDRLARTIELELTYARKRQYDMFLSSPDFAGRSSTTYVYRTAAAPKTVQLTTTTVDRDDDKVGWIVVGLALAVALPAAAIAWAHS